MATTLPKTLFLLGTSHLSAARRRARQILGQSWGAALPTTVFERLGSTLFLDDDPDKLAEAFAPAERLRFTPQVLAACIVIFGRERLQPAFT